jgi:predicted GNAT family N-acyltransferase
MLGPVEPPADPGYTVEQIDVARALTLRHALLRPGGPGTAVAHPADHESGTLHFGAYRNGVLVGVATLVASPVPAGSSEVTGVAVEYGHRGKGVGAQLLDACLTAAAVGTSASVTAAVPAAVHAFFAHAGFARVGDPYEAPDGIPHYRMSRPAAATG